jgi:MFS family permease
MAGSKGTEADDAPARSGFGGRLSARVPALAAPAFRRFIFGAFLGSSGAFLQSTAQGWLVLGLTNSPAALGLVSALGMAPILVLSVFAGVVADRVDRRRMLVATQLLSCATALMLALLATTGAVQFWHIAVLAVVSGIAIAVQTPAYQAIVSSLVDREALGSAVALNSAQYNLSRIIGPALAGAIIGMGGLFLAFWGNAIALMGVAWIYAGLPKAPAASLARTQASLWTNLMDGVRYVAGRRELTALVLLTGLPALTVLNYLVLLPVYARDVLGIGAPGLGLLSGGIGAGALVAAFSLAVFRPSGGSGRSVLLSLAAMAAAEAVFATSRFVPLSMAALAVLGGSQVLYYATSNTLIQVLAPARLRGRVMSLYILVSTGLIPFGNLLGGIVAEQASPTIALVVASAATLVGVAVTALAVPELRALGRSAATAPS